MALISLGKALSKLKSATQLGGGIVIPRNLFGLIFLKCFQTTKQGLSFRTPIVGLSPSSTFAARTQSVWNYLRSQFRRQVRDSVFVKFYLIFNVNTPVWLVWQAHS